MNNAIVSFLRGQLRMAHGWLEDTLKDVGDMQAHWNPGGNVNRIAGYYGHILATEDVFMNSLAGKPPLMAGSYAAMTGFSAPPPQGNWHEWGISVSVDVDAAHTYAQAVYANTDAVLTTMSDADLQKPFDLSALGMGQQTYGTVLNLLILNCYCHSGEISTIKGLQGLQGYPL
jgi:uncharacterized damage-inducible protein DinB